MKTSVLHGTAIAFAIALSGLLRGERALAADACPAPNFVAAGTFGAENQPVSVAVGDFNADTRLDLAVANRFSTNISVLLGNGNGTFQTAVNYGAGAAPSSVAVGDLNADSQLDLVVTDAATTNVWILLGNGNGTFQTAMGSGAENLSQSVAVGDFDRDGTPDLAVAIRVSSLISVLIGKGNGAFDAPTNYGTGPDPFSVAVGDFNGDSILDLATVNAALFEEPPGVSVFIGKTNGTFNPAVDYAAGTSPRSLAIGDFDGDGRADLAVANYGTFVGSQFTNSSISILLGNGNGTFQAPVTYLAGEGPLSLVATNFNDDAALDLAVANDRSMNVSVLIGNGNGTFAPPVSYATGGSPRSVAAGDFNGDGQPDLAVVKDSGVFILLRACADLSISKTDAPDPVVVGSNVTYTLTVNNDGVTAATGVSLTDSLPPDVSLVSATPSQGSCTNSGGVINCDLGNIANGAQATVAITVATTTAGSTTNTAIVSSTTSDPSTANNSVTAMTTVLPLVSISATDPSSSEFGPDTGIFTVSRAGGTSGTLTVQYTVSGSASTGVDYDTLSGVVMIPDGLDSATIVVSPLDDPEVEPTETVIVTLASSSAYAIDASANSATASIFDNDTLSLLISDVTVTEGNPGVTNAVFKVILTASISETVTVDFATANGTAVAGSDYVATNGTLSFPPGTTNHNVVVTVFGDALNEANEVFFINLSDATNAPIVDGEGMGTINNDDPLPSLSVNGVTVTERSSATTNAVFTVSLSGASGQTITVNYATVNGTANAGSDYVSTNGMVAFSPGDTDQSITVTVLGDMIDETNETFFVELSNPDNATVGDAQGVGTINDDDAPPVVSISSVTVTERNTATTNAVFTISLSAASEQTITVNYATANEMAIAGSDYVATNGTMTFLPGDTNQNVTVTVLGDVLDETNETFLVNLSNPINTTIGDGQGIGMINDNDDPPSISIGNATVVEGDTGTTNAVFTVRLSEASGQTITVNFATDDDSAIAGSDYVSTNGTLTFAPGSTAENITVRVNGDSLDEINEMFEVNLSNPTNTTFDDRRGTGTIVDDDAPPIVSISGVTVVEGNTGTTNAVFTVSLSGASGQTVTLNFATANGTASSGSDYVATNGTLTFPPGSTAENIIVIVNGDFLDETNETFFVELSNPDNAAIGEGQAIGTIIDDDAPPPSISISDVTVLERNTGTTNAVFTLSLSSSNAQTVTVSFSTADGTAIAGSDYVSTNGIVTFPPGDTNQNITVTVLGDVLDETNEAFFVQLSNPDNATLGDAQGMGIISDNDAPPSISISDVTVVEGNTGTTNAVFTVSLSAVSGQAVTVNFVTLIGTASAGVDFVATNSPLTFPPGSIGLNIIVRVHGDSLDEIDETFFVELSNPNNATLGDALGMATIIDDDAPPSISISDITVVEGNTGTTNAVFTVSLSAVSGQAVTVNFATANGTAIAGSDYVSTNGTLTFLPDSTDENIIVQVNGDSLDETNETFLLNLSGAVNATINDGQATGTILDDDSLPVATIELSGSDVIIRFTTVPDRMYRVERAVDLSMAPWTTVADQIAGTGAIVQVEDPGGAGHASRFYRIVVLPETAARP